jgi:hypothetical protein
MGLKEDIKEMYRQLGIMDERMRQVEALEIPKKGQVAKELAKEKNQKDFDKKKKEWQGKLDKADAVLKDLDTAFDKFTDQIKKVDSANNAQRYESSQLTVIDDYLQQAEGADKALKAAGHPPAFEKVIARLQAQRQSVVDAKKQLFDEVKREVTAMWKLFDTAFDKYVSVKRGDLADEKEALKNAKFGAGAGSKVKVKAGAR